MVSSEDPGSTRAGGEPDRRPRVVILTGSGLEHQYVAGCLAEAIGGCLAGVIIERRPDAGGRLRSIGSLRRRYSAATIVERVITKLVRGVLRSQRRHRIALSRVLGDVRWVPTGEVPLLETREINGRATATWLRGLEPDFLLIYGTGIVGKRILRLPARAALNLHTGVSPYYRGSSCAFWPLYNGEPHMVGATVHQCTPEVDGGGIYARISVPLADADDPYTAFAKCVKAGAALYARVAARLIDGAALAVEKQDFSQGREYRFKDKTFWRELAMEFRVRSKRLAGEIERSRSEPLPFRSSDAE